FSVSNTTPSCDTSRICWTREVDRDREPVRIQARSCRRRGRLRVAVRWICVFFTGIAVIFSFVIKESHLHSIQTPYFSAEAVEPAVYPVGCNITDLGNFVVGVAVRLQMDHLALLRRQISQKRQQAVPVIHCLCQRFLPGGKKSVQFSGIFLILLQISPAHGP